MNNKIKALAQYLDIDEEEINEGWDENHFDTDYDGKYIVCDYDTAYALAIEDVKNLYDELGLDSFSERYQEYILDNFLDEKALQDTMYEYIKDDVYNRDDEEIIENAKDWDLIDEDEIIEKAKKEGLIDEDDYYASLDDIDNLEDFVDVGDLREKIIDETYSDYKDNPVSYFKEFMDDEEFSKWIKKYDYVDLDAIARDVVRTDGIGQQLGSFDFIEIALDDDLYAYRIV